MNRSEIGIALPPDLRTRLLRAVDASPRELVTGTDEIRLFANQTQALRELLDDLNHRHWRSIAEPYSWTVHQLVAHLLVIERYTAAQLGLAPPASGHDEAAHLAMGSHTIAAESRRSPLDTSSDWQGAAKLIVDRLEAGEGPAMDASVELHGWPFTVTTALVARAFEVWTHADDIRRAASLEPVAPRPSDLRTMSSSSVSTLPFVLPLVAPESDFVGARVVLTGDGGGTFDLGDRSCRQALLVVDVVDYCRLAARRVRPDDLESIVEGDRDTANELLAAAQAFSV